MGSARLWLCGLALVVGLAGAAAPAGNGAAPGAVYVLTVAGAIGPATALRFQRSLQRAQQQQAVLLVLQLDTPGGLDTSMRDMIQALLASALPVAVFVAPQGARAASAGTYLLYAAHVAAMAPATNLGAATPVEIGLPGAAPDRPQPPGAASAPDAMTAKRVNDAAAYIRGLARLRGRNAEWAERAVREATSLDAQAALAQGVIDLVAADLPDLLRQLDGRQVRVGERRVTLTTAHAPLWRLEPDWRDRLLASISHPSVALALMTLGLYGLIFELANPGFVLPGVVGGVSLLLGLYGLQMLPINHAGLGLIVLGLAFLVAEAFLPSFGVLGLGGIVAFAFGAALLIDSDAPGMGIPWPVIAALCLAAVAFVFGVFGLMLRTRRRPVVSGTATLIGARAELLELDGDLGWARVAGTPWRVRGVAGLSPGQPVRVIGIEGLTLLVRAAEPARERQGGRP